MGVAEIVVVSEVDWVQRDGLALGVDAVLDDVGAACDQNWILKQIVGCAVLLEDHDNVLDAWWCGNRLGGTTSAAAVQVKENYGGDEQGTKHDGGRHAHDEAR